MKIYFLLGIIIFFIFIICKEFKCRLIKQRLFVVELDRHYFILVSSLFYFMLSIRIFRYYYNFKTSNEVLYTSVICALLGIVLVIKGLQKDIINDYGVCTIGGNYRWKKINDYKWKELDEKIINKRTIEYFDLAFHIKITKINRYITGRKHKEVILKVDKNTKYEIQKYLDNNFKFEK